MPRSDGAQTLATECPSAGAASRQSELASLVDRYVIADSAREGFGGFAPIDPAAYAEDWDRITEKVLLSTYRMPLEGRELRSR